MKSILLVHGDQPPNLSRSHPTKFPRKQKHTLQSRFMSSIYHLLVDSNMPPAKAVLIDGKPLFLYKLADWLEEWQDKNFSKFTEVYTVSFDQYSHDANLTTPSCVIGTKISCLKAINIY